MDQEEFLKKSQIVIHVSIKINLDVQTAGGWDSIRIELHYLNGRKIFAWVENRFLSYALSWKSRKYYQIVKSSTQFRKAVSVEEQVASMLCYLSNECRLTKRANAFGIGKSTVSHIIHYFCKAITVHLTSKYIKIPRTEEAVKELVSKLYSETGFPQCIGAIGGTHVPIK